MSKLLKVDNGLAEKAVTPNILPLKMQLPKVEFSWNNVWYFLRGEPYIRGVETDCL